MSGVDCQVGISNLQFDIIYTIKRDPDVKFMVLSGDIFPTAYFYVVSWSFSLLGIAL